MGDGDRVGRNDVTRVAVSFIPIPIPQPLTPAQFFDDDLLIRIDADVARDPQTFDGDVARAQLGVREQGARGGEGVGAARSDGERAILFVGRDHVAVAGEQEGASLVGDDEQGFEVAQNLVSAPLLAQLDGGAFEIAVILFELTLEACEQREGVRARAREPGKDTLVIESSHFARRALHHGVAERDLPVAGHRDARAAPDEQDGRAAQTRLLIVSLHVAIGDRL